MQSRESLLQILKQDDWVLAACLQMQAHAKMEGALGFMKRGNRALEDLIYALHETAKVPLAAILALYEEAYEEGRKQPLTSHR